MAGRTPLACLAILAVLVAAAFLAPTASALQICTDSTPACYPMSVYKSGPAYVNAGDPATYTFTVYNNTGFDTFSDVTVTELAPGVALVTGKWELTLSKETVGGRYSLVFKKLSDGWRIIHDHTSG